MPNLTTETLRIHAAPAGPLLQALTPVPNAPAQWRTLRPVQFHGTLHYVLGTRDAWTLHPLDEVIPLLLRNEFDPVPIPTPPEDTPIARACAEVDPGYLEPLVVLGLGDPDVVRALHLSTDDLPIIHAALAESGLHVVRPTQACEALVAHERTYREELARAAAQRAQRDDVLDAPDSPNPHSTAAAPTASTSTPMAYGVVRPLSEDGMRRLAKKFPGALDEGRIRWPFKDMPPSSEVRIPAAMAVRAQRAVHAYGRANGWKFRTLRDRLTGDLLVYRVDAAPTSSPTQWDIKPT